MYAIEDSFTYVKVRWKKIVCTTCFTRRTYVLAYAICCTLPRFAFISFFLLVICLFPLPAFACSLVLSLVFSSTWPWPRYSFALLFLSFCYCFVFYLSSFFMSLPRFPPYLSFATLPYFVPYLFSFTMSSLLPVLLVLYCLLYLYLHLVVALTSRKLGPE